MTPSTLFYWSKQSPIKALEIIAVALGINYFNA